MDLYEYLSDECELRQAHVTHPDFKELYLRKTPVIVRPFDGPSAVCKRAITVATVRAAKPGSGAFTRLVIALARKNYAVYVETVSSPKFAAGLVKLGFKKMNPASFGTQGHDHYALYFMDQIVKA